MVSSRLEYEQDINEYADNELDKDTFDVGELGIEDIKINPDFYIHTALLKAQDALIKDNIKDGFAQYRIIIEHIEVLATASKIIEEQYLKDVEDYKNSDAYNKITDDFTKSTALANKKLYFIMRSVFRHKTATDSIVLDTRKRTTAKLKPIEDINEIDKDTLAGPNILVPKPELEKLPKDPLGLK